MTAYYLTQQDRDRAAAFAASVARRPRGTQGYVDDDDATDGPQDAPVKTPDVYIAVPPCGTGIPGRMGTAAGVAICCIFQIMSGGVLAPMAYADGVPLQAPVYNIYEHAWPPMDAPGAQYICIIRDKYGKWLCEPYGGSLSTATTTTTTSSTTTTIGRLGQVCGTGRCKYTWDGTVWNQITGCVTTTTTTAAGGTTTTPAGCICGTPTTTTTTPCGYCYYPPQCGTVVGQCYYAPCADGPTTGSTIVQCTTSTTTTSTTTTSGTTTTTCDCHTTSTAGYCCSLGSAICGGPTVNGGFNCTWAWNGSGWVPAYNNCDYCIPPPAGPPPATVCAPSCATWVSFCGQCTGPNCCCPCCGFITPGNPATCCPNNAPCVTCYGIGGIGGGGGGGGQTCECGTDAQGNCLPCTWYGWCL